MNTAISKSTFAATSAGARPGPFTVERRPVGHPSTGKFDFLLNTIPVPHNFNAYMMLL